MVWKKNSLFKRQTSREPVGVRLEVEQLEDRQLLSAASPVALDDFATVATGQTINIDVLSNDLLGNSTNRVAFVTQPQQGSTSVNRDGTVSFTADPSACLLYTSPSPRDGLLSRMPSSA